MAKKKRSSPGKSPTPQAAARRGRPRKTKPPRLKRKKRRGNITAKQFAALPNPLAASMIEADTSICPRFISDAKVNQIAKVYRRYLQWGRPAPLPPLVICVYREKSRDPIRFILADGFHRYLAWLQLDVNTKDDYLPVKYVPGDKHDAFMIAVGNNVAVVPQDPLNKMERAQAARRMILNDVWSRWSSRDIARFVKLSPQTVASLRKRLKPGDPEKEDDSPEKPTDLSIEALDRLASEKVNEQATVVEWKTNEYLQRIDRLLYGPAGRSLPTESLVAMRDRLKRYIDGVIEPAIKSRTAPAAVASVTQPEEASAPHEQTVQADTEKASRP